MNHTEYIWIKLEKNYFNFDNNIYIAFTYISPLSSSFSGKNDDIYELLENDISQFSSDGHCMLLGDFNAKTNTDADYILDNIPDDSACDIGLLYSNKLKSIDTFNNKPHNNQDTHQTDQFGTKLLDLCKACDLRIANGRLLGDHLGSYTCFNYNSTPSVIDYLLVDANLIDSVEIFHVHPLLPTSIHCCISTVLKYRFDIRLNDSSENNDQTLRTTGTRYIWSPVHELSFKQALSSQSNTSSLNMNLHEEIHHDLDSIDTTLQKLNNIITDAADSSNIPKHKIRKVTVKENKKEKVKNGLTKIAKLLLLTLKQLFLKYVKNHSTDNFFKIFNIKENYIKK